jgi:hypothetical protein
VFVSIFVLFRTFFKFLATIFVSKPCSSSIYSYFLFYFFFVTCIFPVLSMQSESLGTWLPVILATAFNFGDTLGRVVREMYIYLLKSLSQHRDLGIPLCFSFCFHSRYLIPMSLHTSLLYMMNNSFYCFRCNFHTRYHTGL